MDYAVGAPKKFRLRLQLEVEVLYGNRNFYISNICIPLLNDFFLPRNMSPPHIVVGLAQAVSDAMQSKVISSHQISTVAIDEVDACFTCDEAFLHFFLSRLISGSYRSSTLEKYKNVNMPVVRRRQVPIRVHERQTIMCSATVSQMWVLSLLLLLLLIIIIIVTFYFILCGTVSHFIDHWLSVLK